MVAACFTSIYLSLFLLSVSCPPSLKPLDVQFMKAIHNKVNVVPVIAKADTLTLRERERLKRRVRATVTHCSPNKQQLLCVDGPGFGFLGLKIPWYQKEKWISHSFRRQNLSLLETLQMFLKVAVVFLPPWLDPG